MTQIETQPVIDTLTTSIAPIDKRLFVEPFGAVPRARGYFEQIVGKNDGLHISGWMLQLEAPFTRIQVWIDGKPAGEAMTCAHPGVRDRFWWVPHADRAGFHAVVPQMTREARHIGRIDLLAYVGSYPVGTLGTWFRTDIDEAVIAPPPQLMERVAAHSNAHFFRLGALRNFGEFLTALRRHRPIGSIRRVLDWGCGCGRLASQFMTLPDVEVSGCDIDQQAVAWCSENLPAGRFTPSGPWPPLPYDDASFDLIVAFSVFTHLTRDAQNQWLTEMRRVLAPGGVLLASVHGPFAARFDFPNDYPMRLARGVFDVDDSRLDGIAPQQYYRGTYQTLEYTFTQWAKYLEIVEYIERGVSNHQDMVVLRKPAAKG